MPPDARADVVDVIHFSNAAHDLAAADEPSTSNKRVIGSRIMVTGFTIPRGKLSLANCPDDAMKPTLYEMRAETKIRD